MCNLPLTKKLRAVFKYTRFALERLDATDQTGMGVNGDNIVGLMCKKESGWNAVNQDIQ